MYRNIRLDMQLFLFLLYLICLINFANGKATSNSNSTFWIPKNPPMAYYKFNCKLDPDKEVLRGDGTIRIVNTTKNNIYRLAIDWAINDFQSIELKSQGQPVGLLKEYEINLSAPPIVFELNEPLLPAEELELTLTFSMIDSLPAIKGMTILSDGLPERMLFRKFLPTLWWGIPTHENYEVKLMVPPGFAVATSGRLDQKTGYYRSESVRSFGLFIGREYQILEADAGETRIRCFYIDQENYAQLVLETAVDAINFLRNHFGFYPYNILNIVPGSRRSSGGFNLATNMAVLHSIEKFAERTQAWWRTITVHEIGHMYWGEYVMEKDFPDWLWLGLGIYTQREYFRSKKPGPNNPHGYLTDKLNFNFNGLVKHGKGYSIISALDCILGHQTFDRIVQQCLKKFAGNRLGAFEFQQICEEESQQDLTWFFEQWVGSNKFPSYEIVSQECQENGNGFVSTVFVECLGTLKMPIPLMATFSDGSQQLQFTDRLIDKNVLVFNSASPLKQAVIDPDTVIALVSPPPAPDTYEQMVNLNKKIQNLPWTGAGAQALEAYQKAIETDWKDSMQWFKLVLTLYDGSYYQEALKAIDYTFNLSDGGLMWRFITNVWKGHLLDLLGRREEALAAYQEAMANDPGSPMIHSQYNMKIDKEWVEQRLKEPFKR
jgi:hypothetical protein